MNDLLLMFFKCENNNGGYVFKNEMGRESYTQSHSKILMDEMTSCLRFPQGNGAGGADSGGAKMSPEVINCSWAVLSHPTPLKTVFEVFHSGKFFQLKNLSASQICSPKEGILRRCLNLPIR